MAIRKNIYRLTQAEVDQYILGIKILKARGEYDRLVRTHHQVMSAVHGSALFLPWHRAFLNTFENRMRIALADPGFALPYWDWTHDHASTSGIGAIWNPNLLGGEH